MQEEIGPFSYGRAMRADTLESCEDYEGMVVNVKEQLRYQARDDRANTLEDSERMEGLKVAMQEEIGPSLHGRAMRADTLESCEDYEGMVVNVKEQLRCQARDDRANTLEDSER